MSKNIILYGFMGCGKTTVGKILAELMQRQFADMDYYIEQKAGLCVNEIFARFGQEHFRALEAEACTELAQMQNMVIAAGGGAVLFEANRNVLQSSGTLVFLDVPVNTIVQRLKHDNSRPLLNTNGKGYGSKEEAIIKLYDDRFSTYQACADVTIDAETSPKNAAERILKTLTQKNLL
jgi:shikimate kinase